MSISSNVTSETGEQPANPFTVFSPVGHAFFARDGVKLAFGKRWDGEIIHISQANRGLACGCYCPAEKCRRKLIAKKPDKNMKHHFSHAPLTSAERQAGIAPNCKHGKMTALHAYAEKLLSNRKYLVLPPLEVTLGDRKRTKRSAKAFTFDSAKLETMDGETVPDVILYRGDDRMQVEVFVTHRCATEKRIKIAAADISAVEIDLSGLSRDITLQGLDEAILNSAPREWLHNRKHKILLGELEKEEQEETERIAKKRELEVDQLKQAFGTACKRVRSANWKDDANVVAITNYGHGNLFDWLNDGEGFFSVHPKVWKATIINDLLRIHDEVEPAPIATVLEARGWIVERFSNPASNHNSLWEEAKLPRGGPEQTIFQYLKFLAEKGVAEKSIWGWTLTQSFSTAIDKFEREQQRIVREIVERDERKKELNSLIERIFVFADKADYEKFSLAGWMDHPFSSDGSSPREMAEEGNLAWRSLRSGLLNTIAVLKDEVEVPVEAFGLPIVAPINRMRSIHQERAVQRLRLAEEEAQSKSLERVNKLVKAETEALEPADLSWIDTINMKLNGLSPRQAAEKSEPLLYEALQLLRVHAERLAKKHKWVNELESQALKILNRQDQVDAFLKGGDPDLPGFASPRIYTVDKTTMEKCIALLVSRVKKKRK